MILDLVPDRDVVRVMAWFPDGYIAHRTEYRKLFSLLLNRPLSQEETDEILSKQWYGPHPFENTWAAVERVKSGFWRSTLGVWAA